MGWILLAVLVVAGAGIVLHGAPAAYLGFEQEGASHLLKAVAMLVSIGGACLLGMLPRGGIGFRQAASWAAMGLAAVSLYGYRDDIISTGLRLAGDVPSEAEAVAAEPADTGGWRRTVTIEAMENGQFGVNVLVNNARVTMLADTGATLVTLTSEDAERAGISLHMLDFDVPLRTANGTTHGAVVELDEVDVGGILVRDVAAVVSKPGVLHVSLLGMSYFRQIGAFELSGDQLVLSE